MNGSCYSAITSFFTQGFSSNGLWSFLIAAVVITVLDYLVERMMGSKEFHH